MAAPISQMMAEADFGRTSLRGLNRVIATRYRQIVWLLVTLLLLAHIPLTEGFIPLLVAIVLYALYVGARRYIILRYGDRFYEERNQLIRAQIGIVGVTALIWLLGSTGSAGSLWVLYFPALFLTSRYVRSQKAYLLTLAQVALLAAFEYAYELRDANMQLSVLAGQVVGRAAAVFLPGFFIHYLSRLEYVARRGVIVRDGIVRELFTQVLTEENGLTLWEAVRRACQRAVNGVHCDLFLVDRPGKCLRRLERKGDHLFLGQKLSFGDDHIAALALEDGRTQGVELGRGRWRLAAPISGTWEMPKSEHLDANRTMRHTLAVVVIDYAALDQADRRFVNGFLLNLLDLIWPVCTYASLRIQSPHFDGIEEQKLHRLELDDVLEGALDTVCSTLGFEYATISLVDEERHQIGTVRGRNVPCEWINVAHHPLDSKDIQADVLRRGVTVVLDHWDDRFDRKIWTLFNHHEFVRVWVPLGRVGTIEAGFRKPTQPAIPPLLVRVLERYAQAVTLAIQNARRYRAERQRAVELEQQLGIVNRLNYLLTRLHDVGRNLQIDPQALDDDTLLRQLAAEAAELLGAELVMVYPMHIDGRRVAPPIIAGEIIGRGNLRIPADRNDIIGHIIATRSVVLEPNVATSPLFSHTGEAGGAPVRPRTFTQRQRIRAFAGVPLVARGMLLGVLCVNYRRSRREFTEQERQWLTLFAQQATAIIASSRVIIDRERVQLANDLHDMVKSSLRGLILLSSAASSNLGRAPALASQHLHEIRRAAWSILSDIDTIIRGLADQRGGQQLLDERIHYEVQRLLGNACPGVQFELDPRIGAVPIGILGALLLAVREGVINAKEHAAAASIIVRTRTCGESVVLEIIDDGCGFTLEPGTHQRGLASMRERIGQLGGQLEVISALGVGTRLSIRVPREEGNRERAYVAV